MNIFINSKVNYFIIYDEHFPNMTKTKKKPDYLLYKIIKAEI